MYDGKIAPFASFLCNCEVYGSQFLLFFFVVGNTTDFLPTLTSSLFFNHFVVCSYCGCVIIISGFQAYTNISYWEHITYICYLDVFKVMFVYFPMW